MRTHSGGSRACRSRFHPRSGAVFTGCAFLVGSILGATVTCSFTVTVVDKERPKISCPDGIVVPATSSAGAVVTFNATDNCSAAPEFASDPASGSLFPIGVTTVIWAAKDGAGNVGTGSFTVTVKGAPEQIADLVQLVRSFNLQRGIETSLLFQLRESAASLSRGQVPATCGTLQAFINYVSALTGIWVTPDQADQLIQDATRIRAVLNCSAIGA